MTELIEKTVCFTGHREIPFLRLFTVKPKLKKTVEDLINQGYCYFGAGGALGFDTLAARIVLDLRKTHSQVKLILVLPCKSQADRWSYSDKEVYESIKEQADKVVYTSEEYTKGCMFKRNRYLVDKSSVCVCYLDKDTGGTAYTVNYAYKKGVKIINLAKKVGAYHSSHS